MFDRLKRLLVAAVAVPLVLSLTGCAVQSVAMMYNAGRVLAVVAAQSNYCTHNVGTTSVGVVCNLLYGGSLYAQSLFFMLFQTALNLEHAGGAMRDPVVVQVPASATGFAGTYTDSSGTTRALAITAGLARLPIDANSNLEAERGMQLVLIDFPSPLDTPEGAYTYTFGYEGGTDTLKAMTVGVLQVGDRTYYPPISTCVTSFADVPAITIPTATAPVDLPRAALGTPMPCTDKQYEFPPEHAPGSVEVVEFYHADLDHYFISWVPDEIAKLDAGTATKGWTRTGRVFRAFTTAQPGTSPVCRFYIPPGYGDSHFYGRGTAECDSTAAKFPQFTFESPTFMYLYLPSAGQCPADTKPVHRVFSNRADANHRYSTDPDIMQQMVGRHWMPEGDGPDLVVMCAPV